MTKPLSMDLRKRAMARRADGETVREIAKSLNIAASSVVKWSQRAKLTGSVAPAKMGGYKPCRLSGEYADWLRTRIAGEDFTLRGLVAELAERGLKVDYKSVWIFVHREGVSFKKKCSSK